MRSRQNNSRTVLYLLIAAVVGYAGYRTFQRSSKDLPSTKTEATQKVHEKKRDAFSMSDPKSLVEAAVQDNPVMVFSKSYCPYCKKAKATLASVLPPEKVSVLELDQRPDGESIQDVLLQMTGGRSVPRVFIGGKFIGGGDDTVRMKGSGELETLLQKAGVLVA